MLMIGRCTMQNSKRLLQVFFLFRTVFRPSGEGTQGRGDHSRVFISQLNLRTYGYYGIPSPNPRFISAVDVIVSDFGTLLANRSALRKLVCADNMRLVLRTLTVMGASQ